jgi:two-component system, cell cycle response regulator DivK
MTIAPHDAVVLVVEDNPDNLFIVTDLLREDLQVRHCEGRAVGWQMFKLLRDTPELQVNLVLLDLQIPGEDGYAVLERIRKTPTLRRLKVVAVTANVMPQDVAKTRAAGFDGFIGKPVSRQRFPEQIRRVLAGEAVWEAR